MTSLGARLLGAAAAGNTARVREVLSLVSRLSTADRPPVVDCQDEDGRTPLMLAAHGGHSAVVRLLLDSGAVLNRQDRIGDTALSLSVADQHAASPDVVRLLLERGADTTTRDGSGATPLYWACGEGDVAAARLLLDAGADPAASNAKGQTCLHFAAQIGSTELVAMLLEAGAPIAPDIDGRNPLWYAAVLGQPSTCRQLVQAGAAVDQVVAGATPLLAVLQENTPEGEGGFAAVPTLLELGADPNAATADGETALWFAAQHGHEGTVAALLAAGADPAATTVENQQQPLMFASENGHLGAVAQLLAAGAPADAQDVRGNTAMIMAAIGGHAAVVRRLLAAGAPVDQANHLGQTTLCFAAEHGHPSLCALLLEAGAAPLHRAAHRYTAAHYAAQAGQAGTLATLLHAEPLAAAAATDRGVLPLHLAVYNLTGPGHVAAARCLLAQGDGVAPAEAMGILWDLLDDAEDNHPELTWEGVGLLLTTIVQRWPLSADDWALVPLGCPGLGAALPAVLRRSTAEAALLVARLPPADTARLRTTLLCLARGQRERGLSLPADLLPRLLAELFDPIEPV